MEFRVLDLFCGAGGFSCGLDSLPEFKTVIGVDFDGNVLETFEKNIKGSIVINGDLTDSTTIAVFLTKMTLRSFLQELRLLPLLNLFWVRLLNLSV